MIYVIEVEKNIKYVNEFQIEAKSVAEAKDRSIMLMSTLVGAPVYDSNIKVTNVFQKEDCYV